MSWLALLSRLSTSGLGSAYETRACGLFLPNQIMPLRALNFMLFRFMEWYFFAWRIAQVAPLRCLFRASGSFDARQACKLLPSQSDWGTRQARAEYFEFHHDEPHTNLHWRFDFRLEYWNPVSKLFEICAQRYQYLLCRTAYIFFYERVGNQ